MTTERAYVADLTAITQFLPALRSAELPAAELDALVGNVDSLLLVHGELLGRLEAAGDSVVGFAHAFCSITPFLRMYSIYCARYGAVVGAVNAAAVNAAALAALEEARGERLDSLLVKPVQRICKYPLFFGELLKALPADCAERPQLQAVAEQVRQMGEEVNGRVKEADQEALKLKLYEELGGAAKLPADLELLSPTRRLVAQADVRLARADVRAAGRRRRHRLALFSDVLLVARPTRKIARALAKGSKPPLELRAVLPMLGCRLASDGGGKALVLSCEMPRLRYKCACASPAAAQALLDAFAGRKRRRPQPPMPTLAASRSARGRCHGRRRRRCLRRHRCRRRRRGRGSVAYGGEPIASEQRAAAALTPWPPPLVGIVGRRDAREAQKRDGGVGDERRQEWDRVRHHSVVGQRHRIGRERVVVEEGFGIENNRFTAPTL